MAHSLHIDLGRLYHCARLVHADLSEYNLLLCPAWQVSDGRKGAASERSADDEELQIVLIDFGQAIERSHPSAKELLTRDLSTVRDFFSRQGITTLSNENAEDFVLAAFEQTSVATELNTTNEMVASEEVKSDTTVWRHSIPGWDTLKDMESLLVKLKGST